MHQLVSVCLPLLISVCVCVCVFLQLQSAELEKEQLKAAVVKQKEEMERLVRGHREELHQATHTQERKQVRAALRVIELFVVSWSVEGPSLSASA